jgi:hypothetical protein
MNDITLVYPYYRNPETLLYQAQHWVTLPHWMNAHLKVRVIDDGSPPEESASSVLTPPVHLHGAVSELYRILEDKPWNQHGARNLGAHVAPHADDWLLMTDMDIVVPEAVLCFLLQCRLDRDAHYFFGREFADGRPDKPHCNSFLVTKKNFWAAGGYNENFCGTYGGDGIFTRALERVSQRVDLNGQKLLGLNDTIEDCSTRGLGRKDTEFHHEYLRIRDATRNQPPHSPLRFTWERVW